jgi:hypothetical protein
MIHFDQSLLSVEIVQLKMVTTSLGGSISVVDEAASAKAKRETTKRVEVPMAVARAFIMKTKKITKYIKPVYTAVVRYGKHVIALERHPLAGLGALETEGFDGKPRRWIPDCEANINQLIKPMLASNTHKWYFDGRYMFSFEQDDLQVAAACGANLTEDGRFRKVPVTSVDLQELSNKDKLAPSNRSCMAFIATNGAFAISPPIWKNLSDVGSTQFKGVDKEDKMDNITDVAFANLGTDTDGVTNMVGAGTFDRIDETLSVNLNFALKAGQEIGQQFGYEFVEPLQLPRLMIELHTVNLPTVPKTVKATYDIGLKFTHAMAWLLGMSRKANDLDTYIVMRSLMKYLTKKGIFRSNVFDASRVFVGGQTAADVPVKSLVDMMKNVDQLRPNLSVFLAEARRNGKGGATNIQNVGGLLNEEE